MRDTLFSSANGGATRPGKRRPRAMTLTYEQVLGIGFGAGAFFTLLVCLMCIAGSVAMAQPVPYARR